MLSFYTPGEAPCEGSLFQPFTENMGHDFHLLLTLQALGKERAHASRGLPPLTLSLRSSHGTCRVVPGSMLNLRVRQTMPSGTWTSHQMLCLNVFPDPVCIAISPAERNVSGGTFFLEGKIP